MSLRSKVRKLGLHRRYYAHSGGSSDVQFMNEAILKARAALHTHLLQFEGERYLDTESVVPSDGGVETGWNPEQLAALKRLTAESIARKNARNALYGRVGLKTDVPTDARLRVNGDTVSKIAVVWESSRDVGSPKESSTVERAFRAGKLVLP